MQEALFLMREDLSTDFPVKQEENEEILTFKLMSRRLGLPAS